MTPVQKEMLKNVRRAAEASLESAQEREDGESIDGFQHIIDDIERLEWDADQDAIEEAWAWLRLSQPVIQGNAMPPNYRVVETDNHGRDYADEKFVNIRPTTKERAQAIADAINAAFCTSDYAGRHWKVVEDGYELDPAFEP